jgi:GDPmannose 4,6-dehydratase
MTARYNNKRQKILFERKKTMNDFVICENRMGTNENQKTAVIFGVTGQDGSYMSELLLKKEYRVIGVGRRSSVDTKERIRGATLDHPAFTYAEGDITDLASVTGIISEHKPDECYNLAAQSHVGTSFKQPVATFNIDAVGVLNILESIRIHSPETRFYQASTSELYGDNYDEYDEDFVPYQIPHNGHLPPLTEQLERAPKIKKYQGDHTEFAPRSPYAVAKIAAHYLVHTYRESYGLHASCGILFNHESERRGENFVTRKISKWVGQLAADYALSSTSLLPATLPEELQLALGNLDAYRDWGHAEDYVKAMWMMLQMDEPDDYVIATGVAHSVRDFLDAAFAHIGVKDWSGLVRVDPQFFRPAEVEYLCGYPEKALDELGWEPEVTFEQLVGRMVDHDQKKAIAEKTLQQSSRCAC